jgi:hypothetical protein
MGGRHRLAAHPTRGRHRHDLDRGRQSCSASILGIGRPPKSLGTAAPQNPPGPQAKGFGEVGPTGLHRWYDEPDQQKQGEGEGGYGWADILKCWRLIEADLQDRGIDVGDRSLTGVMKTRTWRWLKVRIEGLLSVPPVLVWTPDEKPIPVWVQQTRLALALDPPDLTKGR